MALASTLISAGVYLSTMTEWYTALGKYGTVLFRTWMIVPLILSFCVDIAGGVILWEEYKRED